MLKIKQKMISIFIALAVLLVTVTMGLASVFATPTPVMAAEGTWTLVTDANSLAIGDQVIIAAKDSAVALSTTQNKNNRGQAAFTKDGNTITFDSDVQLLTLEAGTISETFAFNTGSGYLYAASSSGNYLRTETTLSTNSSWKITITDDGTATIVAQGSYTRNTIQYNQSSSLFACYGSASQKAICLYKLVKTTGGGGGDEPACEHANTTTTTTDATCTEAGSTVVTCDDCGETVSTETIPALNHPNKTLNESLSEAATCETAGKKAYDCPDCGETIEETLLATGHNYIDGFCATCGVEQPSNLTLTFDDTAKRTAYSTSQQVWEENGIVFTNDKASSTNDVADYSNPVRLYKNSEVIIECANMGKIEFNSSTGDYLTNLKTSLNNIPVDFTENGNIITVEFASTQNKFTFALSGGQVRLNSITVYVAAESGDEPTCEHENQTTTTIDATCTEAGSIVVTCDKCGEEISNTAIPAGHKYENGICTVCQEKQPSLSTLTFDDKAKRTTYTDDIQVWQENGITVTNNKADSTTNVGDYANPARFYKNSTVTIEYPGMVVIEILANNSTYATALGNSITDTTVQVNGSKVMITFAESQDSYTLTCSAKIFVDSITTYTTAHIDTASITVGESLSMNYYVILPNAYSSATMRFTLDDKTVENINGEKQTDGRYKFTFVNIPPQCIAENITAAVVYNESEIAKLENYSIATYVNNQLEKIKDSTEDKDVKLRNLLNSILAYGEAAKNYCAENGSQGASEIPESTNVFNIVNADLTNKEVKSYVVWFTGANLLFDYDNKICVTLSSTENVKLRVKINDGEYTDYTPTSTAFLTDGILPTDFDSVYTFELYYDGVLMQTLTYSVNSYAYKMQKNGKIGALCVALYNYGVAAEAYQA